MLRVNNVHKTYHQAGSELRVLKGISLAVEKGDVLCIVGPSGAGKSTLLHILGGLDKPNEGQVLFDGADIYKLSDPALAKLRNKHIGFIFQFYHLLPEFTALENILLPALVSDEEKDTKEAAERGKALLNEVGLAQRASHRPRQLSGGEQQRVAIARALMNGPSVIFCDEPTGNLDSETGKSIVSLLMDLNRKNRQTLVIVTHDENIARQSHKVVRLKDGM
ncbi:MAG: ABC transporter ATP-binding protein, partial [Omnitrophica WOR_2 bacterium GWA2_47_8]